MTNEQSAIWSATEALIIQLIIQLAPYVTRGIVALVNLLVDAIPDSNRDFIWSCLEIIRGIGTNDAVMFEDKKRYARDAILVLEQNTHRAHDPTLFKMLNLDE